MHTRATNLLALLITVVALGACASTGNGDSEPYATVTIENDGTATVTVYTLRSGGTRMRLGQVTGLSTAEFPVRRNMVTGTHELQLLIDPVGSPQTYPTRSIPISEGDHVRLVVSSFIR